MYANPEHIRKHRVNLSLNDTEARLAEAMAAYTHIVFCPVRSFISGEADPARMADHGYHARYEIVIWSLILDQRQPHDMLVLGTSNLEDRIEKVRSFVRT